jgi:predicted amidohydrolase
MTAPSRRTDAHGTGEVVDGFRIVERTYSHDDRLPSVGLANIHAVVPEIERNKEHIERAAQIFKDRGATFAIFPEFSLSGYFWDDEVECRAYMDKALIEHHLDWIEHSLVPMFDDRFRGIVLNNLARGRGDKYVNRTFLVRATTEGLLEPAPTYDKVFLPGIEKQYTDAGYQDRLVIESPDGFGRFGFTTCYDYLFTELLREYAFTDGVDAVIQIACWRAAASREYPLMNVRTDEYYGDLWDKLIAASSAQNQVWTIACNAVGRHEVTGAVYWGGSGVWAPSGLRLVQASNFEEELLLVHHLDIRGSREFERADFDYEFDFKQVYRRMDEGERYTRRFG